MTLVSSAQATWPVVEALGPESIALICIGATEQHGPHLPIELDTLIAGAVGAGVAGCLDVPVLLFGPFPLGLSQHHVGFPGTVSISAETLAAVLEAYISSCERAGISKIALFSGHGGNFEFLGDFCRRRQDRHPATRLSAYTDLHAMINAGRRVVESAGLEWPACDAHAGLLETSLALHLLGPATVGDFGEVIGYNSAEPGWLDRFFSGGVRSLTDTGVVGDPRAATAELGGGILTAITASVAAHFASELDLQLKERQA